MTPANIINRRSYESRKDRLRMYMDELQAPPAIIRDGALLVVESVCGHSRISTLGYILRQYAAYWWLEKQANLHRWWMALRGKQEAI